MQSRHTSAPPVLSHQNATLKATQAPPSRTNSSSYHQQAANNHRHQQSSSSGGRQLLTANTHRLRPSSAANRTSAHQQQQQHHHNHRPHHNLQQGEQPQPANAYNATTVSDVAGRARSTRSVSGQQRLHKQKAQSAEQETSASGSQRLASGRRVTRLLNGQQDFLFDQTSAELAEPKVEVVAYCRNIQNPQVLRSAIKGFRGHLVNYFVIDSCKVPPFPNDLFHGVDVRWLEMSNTTVQFHNNFLHGRAARSAQIRSAETPSGG